MGWKEEKLEVGKVIKIDSASRVYTGKCDICGIKLKEDDFILFIKNDLMGFFCKKCYNKNEKKNLIVWVYDKVKKK